MKERLLKFSNITFLTFLVLLLCTLQSSLWFQVFGYFPAPAFWIPALIYIALYRTTLEAVIVTYLFCIMASTMTAMPDGLLLTAALLLSFTARLFRQRIFWSSSSYIMLICGFGAFFFHFYYWILSMLIEEHSMRSPEILDWILEALLTPLIAPALFRLFHWVDERTHQEQPAVASAEVV